MKLKNFFTLVLMAVAMSVNAQVTPNENQLWWGFFNENATVIPQGETDIERYEVCFFIPGDNPAAQGATIDAARFYLRSLDGVEDIRLWLTTTLPAKDEYVYDYEQILDKNDLITKDEGFNEIKLNTPWKIGEAGVYVGYSFSITDNSTKENQYPIVCSWGDKPEGNNRTFIYRVIDNAGCHIWWNYAHHALNGNLAMQVLIDGDNFPKNAMSIEEEFFEDAVVMGNTMKADVKVTNHGIRGVKNFSYTVTQSGVESSEMTYNMDTPMLALDEETYVQIPVPAANTEGIARAKITITKVNGQANEETEANESTGMIITLSESAPRTVVVENFTSTCDAYAPRGLVAMERLKKLYPENYIGFNIHGGANMFTDARDPMFCDSYADMFAFVYNYMNAHTCLINRVVGCDTYLGTTDDIDATAFDIPKDIDEAMAEPTEGSIKFKSVEANDDMTQFDVDMEVNFLYDRSDAPYAVAFALVQAEMPSESDDIDSGWPQYNAFRFDTYRPAYQADDMEIFLSGDEYVTGLTYTDVVVAGWGSFDGLTNTVKAPIVKNQTQSFSKSLSLPMGSLLTDTSKLSLIAMLVQDPYNGGEIINAAEYKLYDETAIKGVTDEVADNSTIAVYDLSGRKVNASDIVRGQGGIYIVKQADGQSRKVLF